MGGGGACSSKASGLILVTVCAENNDSAHGRHSVSSLSTGHSFLLLARFWTPAAMRHSPDLQVVEIRPRKVKPLLKVLRALFYHCYLWIRLAEIRIVL